MTKCNKFNFQRIILGVAQFGMPYGVNNPRKSKIPYTAVKEIFKYANKQGICELDSSARYGSAEEVIGKFHRRHNRYKISSKFYIDELGDGWGKDKKLEINLIKKFIEKKIKLLKVRQLETLYFHSYRDFIRFKKDHSFLRELKKSKLIRELGVSVYLSDEIKQVLFSSAVDIIQCPFSIFDNANERFNDFKKIKRKNKKISVRSIFLQGLVFMDPNRLPRKLKSFYDPLIKIQKISKKYQISIEEICIRYVLSFSEIDSIIIGVDSLTQIKRNIKAFRRGPLPQKILNEIHSIKIKNKSLLLPVNWN